MFQIKLKAAWPALRNRAILITVGIAALTTHWIIFSDVFPYQDRLGHDYSYYLPFLLAGFFWWQANGIFSIPWFTPAFCGGMPFFPHPGTMYTSVPQALFLAGGPLFAIRGTFVTFAALGLVGTYLLARRPFRLSRPAAAMAGIAFLFNGFFAARMMVGHLQFHSFMLTPLIAYFVLRPLPEQSGDARWRLGLDAVSAGAGLAYMLHSGNVYGILPAVATVVGLVMILGLRGTAMVPPLGKLALAGVVAGVLSAAKLEAAFAFLSTFPRDGYPLRGIASVGDVMATVFQVLFRNPDVQPEIVVNSLWSLGRHEWEFGFTPIPLILLTAGLGLSLWRRRTWPTGRQLGCAGGLVLVLLLPAALNVYSPAWNDILKTIPVLRNSTNLFRWFMLYIPFVALGTALAIDALASNRETRCAIAAVAAAGMVLLVAAEDRRYYKHQPYPVQPITEGYRAARQAGAPPPIRASSVLVDRSGRPINVPNPNDLLVDGTSSLRCYEAMYGARREWFPRGAIDVGPVLWEPGRPSNLFNPACLVWPEANSCRPGDTFRADQRHEGASFANYGPFDFATPPVHKIAVLVSVAGLAAAALFLLAYAIRKALIARQRLGYQATSGLTG